MPDGLMLSCNHLIQCDHDGGSGTNQTNVVVDEKMNDGKDDAALGTILDSEH